MYLAIVTHIFAVISTIVLEPHTLLRLTTHSSKSFEFLYTQCHYRRRMWSSSWGPNPLPYMRNWGEVDKMMLSFTAQHVLLLFWQKKNIWQVYTTEYYLRIIVFPRWCITSSQTKWQRNVYEMKTLLLETVGYFTNGEFNFQSSTICSTNCEQHLPSYSLAHDRLITLRN